jgi:hypothetical protein
MKMVNPVRFLKSFHFVLTVALAIPSAKAQITISSFDGPVTPSEVSSFRAYVQTLTPPSSNSGNAWAQGGGGEQARGMGLVYEASGDVGTLDQEIRFCDTLLTERNDLAPAPVGQHVIWTGRIDPVWPNSFGSTIGTGGEQGYATGHLGNCARHILQTPSIWNTTVAIGDPHGHGATYLERAKTFVAGADAAIDGHILKSQLNLAGHSNHYYFASGDPYKGGLPVPWNQTMMFNYLFSNMAWAHSILGDDPARVTQYDGIVQANLDWFFTTGSSSYTDKDGNTAYEWAYTLPQTTGEDAEEGQWDVDGFYRLWVSGRYNFPTAKMLPFANTFVDVMTLGPQSYAGRVNGTSGSGHAAHTTTIHEGWLLLADLRPDAYHSMMAADLPSSGSTGSISDFSRFLFVKNRRSQSGGGGGGTTSYEAEASGNSFAGAAKVAACSGCSGGEKVGFIGNGAANYLQINNISVASSGNHTLTIYPVVSGTRSFSISVDGGAAIPLTASGTSWNAPATPVSLTIPLGAGSNSIKFFNDTAFAPDIDRITIQ